MVELWMPGAVIRPGPREKVGYSYQGERTPKRGDVKHSAEGYWDGIHNALDDLNRRASWQFTVGYDRFEQHYPFDSCCWHAGDIDDDGGVAANFDLVGIEHLGMAGYPLTFYQTIITANISYWCALQSGRNRFKRFDGWEQNENGVWVLTEHNQVSDSPTACPSLRVLWTPIQDILDRAGQGVVEEEDVYIRAWVTEANPHPPRPRGFLSYTIEDDHGQEVKTLVPSTAAHESLAAGGHTLQFWPIDRIKKVRSRPGTPEPDAPR